MGRLMGHLITMNEQKLQKARYIQPSAVLLEGILLKFRHFKFMQLHKRYDIAKECTGMTK